MTKQRMLLARRGAAGLLVAALAGCGDKSPTEAGGGTVAYVQIQGAPADGKLYVGQGAVLSAITLDHDRNQVTGVGVSWSSSDTTKATLTCGSSACTLRAKAVGSTVITAASGSKSASFTLTIPQVPVAQVRLSAGNFAMYPTGVAQITATPVDSVGGTLNDRLVTWSSSDASRVTVDASGQVRAVAQGTASITATSGGKSASLTVQVLAAPTADWSAVTEEWGTYQGNAAHTGYVPAVADPRVFQQSWTNPLVPGGRVSPVTMGDGRVYASGGGKLSVLDQGSGATLWSYNFGSVNSVDPPAYADGTVYLQTGGHEDSFLWAFNGADGTLRFRSAYSNQWSSYYAPTIVGQNVFVAGGYYGGMYSFGGTDGAQRWFDMLNQYDEFTPAVRNGVVYAYTGSYSPKVTAADAGTGEVLYEIPDPGFSWDGWSMNMAPVLGATNDLLATQGGRLLSFDLAGRKIGWTVNGTFRGTVAVANGVLYVTNSNALEARRESDGGLLWTWVPPQGSPTSNIVVTKNLVFVSTAAATYAVDTTAHMQVWSTATGGQLALGKQGQLLITTGGSVIAWAVK